MNCHTGTLTVKCHTGTLTVSLNLQTLLVESDAFELPIATSFGAALGAHSALRSIGLGLPTPLHPDDAGALVRSAKAAGSFQESSKTFCNERLPARHIKMHGLKLTSSDLLLIVASIENGSCGQVNSIDISSNEIDDEGMRGLTRGLGASLVGIIPFSAIDLALFNALKVGMRWRGRGVKAMGKRAV